MSRGRGSQGSERVLFVGRGRATINYWPRDHHTVHILMNPFSPTEKTLNSSVLFKLSLPVQGSISILRKETE